MACNASAAKLAGHPNMLVAAMIGESWMWKSCVDICWQFDVFPVLPDVMFDPP